MSRHITKNSILLFALWASPAYAKLNFYYPDSPTSNMSHLKNEMDRLFQRENLDVNFQLFVRELDFKQQITQSKYAVLISPAWVDVATVARIINRHSREIWVDSHVDEGSVLFQLCACD